MSKSYADLIEVESHFSEAIAQFELLIDGLKSKETLVREHGKVEEWLSSQGTELLRKLFQAHFDLRTEREEVQSDIEGNDGMVRTHHRANVKRKLSTLFGKIEYRRMGYYLPGASALYPLDMSLNLSVTKYSDGLRYRVAEEASKHSFDDCVASIACTTGGHTPKRQCEDMVAQVAEDFEGYYKAATTEEGEPSNLLVLTTDSKGIVMRREDLRSATQKAAEAAATKKSKARLGPGEKKNRKRMATVASVYSVDATVRSPEQVMNVSDEPKPSRAKIRNKRVWASVERGEKSVIGEAFEEALSRDLQQQRDWVVVVDGELNQLSYIRKQVASLNLEVTIVLDFIHVLEYVWKASYCFHEVGSEEAEQWVAERALKILRGKSADVAAGMRRSATRKNLSQTDRKAVDKCADYLKNNRPYLKYDNYLREGYPIASGVIEGACRHLINDRMNITGARWGLKTAEAILKLRSLRSSGDLKDYWAFHKKQEWERNHAAQYKNPELVMAA